MRDKRVGKAKRAQALDSEAELDDGNWVEEEVELEPDPESIRRLEGVETDREYEGLLTLSRTTVRRNPTPESDKAAAQELRQAYDLLQSQANASLHKFLAFIFNVYVSARVSGTYEETLAKWCPGKIKGTNRKTHPIAQIIKAALGEEGQKGKYRQNIHQWSYCLRRLVENSVPVASAAEYIVENGGVAKIAKQFSTDQRILKGTKPPLQSSPKSRILSRWPDAWARTVVKKDLEEFAKSGVAGEISIEAKVTEDGRIIITKAYRNHEKS